MARGAPAPLVAGAWRRLARLVAGAALGAAATSGLSGGAAHAQVPGAVADPRQEPFILGRRVKVSAPIFGQYEVAGIVDSLMGDIVVLDTMLPRDRRGIFDGGTVPVEQFRRVRVRVGDVKQAWVSEGVARGEAAVRYALYGSLGGAILFGLSGAQQYNPTLKQMGESAVPGAIAGALVGGLVGGIGGRERWRLVPGPYYLDSPPVGRKP